MRATVPVTLDTYIEGTADRYGVTESSYTTTTGLYAYWLVTGQKESVIDPATGAYTEGAQLGVPNSFPAVSTGDRLTVADEVWEVDGHPIDYSLGPFTEQWVALTGEPPATVIMLRRAVNYIPDGS